MTQMDFGAARRAMIDSQLRTSGVNAPFVLDRMRALPREDYVPEHARGSAYVDRAVPLGGGRFLASPLFHGAMLEEARPRLGDRTLVVDGGSHYLPDLVATLAGSVDTIAADEAATLTDTAAGTDVGGEYDLLLVDGAVEKLPPGLIARVREDGRVLTGLVSNGVTRLAIGRKVAGHVALLPLAEMGIPHLPQFDVAKAWSF